MGTFKHKYPYSWNLKDANFTKEKGAVFSCFACGGGSTMGYKLAGFDVIGCNEIDPKMMKCYIENHHPQYTFLEDIRNYCIGKIFQKICTTWIYWMDRHLVVHLAYLALVKMLGEKKRSLKKVKNHKS